MDNWYRLEKIGLKENIIRKLMKKFEKYEDIFQINSSYLEKITSKENLNKIFESKDIDLLKEEKSLEEKNIKILSIKEGDYPELLRHISKPPLFLYYKGNLEIINQRTIGVVGTRRMTNYGKSATKKIVKGLVESDVTIVSGLAAGVDGIAHKTALDYSGKTIAVVGSGLDIKYPSANVKLWDKISEKGVIFSEYPPGTQPFSWNFPKRNRIIVGLSKGIAVMESYEKGGALLSAEFAVDENRDVFAVPGFISYDSFRGCNNLIKNSKAKLINDANDILDDYNWEQDIKTETNENLKLSSIEEEILKSLVVEKNLDQIISDTKFSAKELLSIITEMEIKGMIKSIPGGKYIKE